MAAAGARGRYGLLLLTLIAAYLVSAVATPSQWGRVLHVAFVAFIALLALGHARLQGRAQTAAQGAVLATAVAAGACAASGGGGVVGAVANGWGGVILLLTVAIIIDVVVHLDRVTPQSLYAALSAYMLIGLMFASFFAMIGDLVQRARSSPTGSRSTPQTLQYFSFTTLTTLGYGDFTAAGSLGRAVAVLEALAGQVFLATLVARLVSAYGAAAATAARGK